MSLAVRLATLLGIAPTIIMAAREEDAVSCAALEGQVLTLVDQRMQQCAMLAQQLAQMLGSMGVPEGSPEGIVAKRVAELVKAKADLDALQPKLLQMEKDAKEAEEAAVATDVDTAIGTYGLDASMRNALLHYRRTAKAEFQKEYAIASAQGQGFGHMFQPVVTQPSATALDRVSMVGGRPTLMGARPQVGAPGGPAAFGGQSTAAPQAVQAAVLELQTHPGRNVTEQAISLVKAKSPGISFADAHGKATELLAQLRQQGAQFP